VLPSEFIQHDIFWIEFDTAVALRGQLEQAKLEEEALEESKTSNKKITPEQEKAMKRSEKTHNMSLKERAARAKRPEEIAKSRGAGVVK